MTDSRLPNELPKEILRQLDPKLAKLYAVLSSAVSSRIGGLVRRALPSRIHPNLLVKYAFLYATAELQAQGDAVSKDHATRSKIELAGEIHGLRTGYWDNAEARQLYRSGRKARQQIEASLEGLLKKWKKVEHVVQKHRSDLPVHLQTRFSNECLARVSKLLHDMRKAAILDEEDILSQKGPVPELSVPAQIYVWWHFAIAPYRGKWNDMHRLAVLWRLSSSKDVETFRSMVVQICGGVKTMRYPFGTSWKSVLFEKS